MNKLLGILSHEHSQQFFYVLQGEANLEVAGVVRVLESGQGCHVPPKVPHQLQNNGSKPLRFLVVSHPRSHGDRVNA